MAFAPWSLPDEKLAYGTGAMNVKISAVEGKHFIVPIILKIESP